MYFGTLVTQTRKEQENWERDMDASRTVTPSRWHALWRRVARLFG
ncbi:hypothetical protein [Caballeronia ptereochthonis]|uniref:Uncharacterized protein n=1 Tax=Caballeronia ptereochthonis TaxID=1777144 RepID=A0A158A509_9BURK|nr:hypothetical protein [Caballeronia ptereochthonis]SAK52878.1 hypothetical protein AWB83_01327 [Caballeronia ptereochthonis]